MKMPTFCSNTYPLDSIVFISLFVTVRKANTPRTASRRKKNARVPLDER